MSVIDFQFHQQYLTNIVSPDQKLTPDQKWISLSDSASVIILFIFLNRIMFAIIYNWQYKIGKFSFNQTQIYLIKKYLNEQIFSFPL